MWILGSVLIFKLIIFFYVYDNSSNVKLHCVGSGHHHITVENLVHTDSCEAIIDVSDHSDLKIIFFFFFLWCVFINKMYLARKQCRVRVYLARFCVCVLCICCIVLCMCAVYVCCVCVLCKCAVYVCGVCVENNAVCLDVHVFLQYHLTLIFGVVKEHYFFEW